MSSSPGLATRCARRDWLLWGALAGATAYNHRALLGTFGGRSGSGASFDEALFDAGVTSPVLGGLVFVALVFARRARIRAALGQPPCLWIAIPCLALGLWLLGWSHAIGAPDLVLPALILELIGGAAWLGGRALVSAIGFPVLALVCVVQLPAILLNRLLFPLQLGTVALTSGLLSLLGRVHEVAGDLILTQGVTFQVIEGCSGLKTILSLMLAAVAYADLVGRRGVEKVLILALAPAIAFLANGMRVLVLVLREVSSESAEHQLYGLLAIAVGVVLLALVELGLSRTLLRLEWRGASVDGSGLGSGLGAGAGSGFAASGRARLAVWGIASVAVSACLALGLPGSVARRDVRLLNIEELPLEILGREARGLRIDDAFLGSVRFAHRFYRAYERPGEGAIRVFVGLSDPESRAFSALSPKTAIPHSGWLALEQLEPLERDGRTGHERERLALRYDPRSTGDRSLDPVDPMGADAERGTNAHAANQVLVEHVRLGFAPWAAELSRAWLGLDRVAASGAARSLVIRVEADADDDREAAELRLRQFVQEIIDWYQSAG